jgi:hypothetical protein
MFYYQKISLLYEQTGIHKKGKAKNIYISLLGNSQRVIGLARYLSRELFSVLSALRNSRTVFSVRGPCREDLENTGMGIDWT